MYPREMKTYVQKEKNLYTNVHSSFSSNPPQKKNKNK